MSRIAIGGWERRLNGLVRYGYVRMTGHPIHVNLEVTRLCNARCDFCRYWRIKQEKRLDDYWPVIEKLKPMSVTFTGGEPLIRPDLEKLIERIKQNCPEIFLTLVTNGSLLSLKRGLSVWRAGLDQLAVSLDFLDERHDQARMIPGLAKKLCQTLPLLVEEGIDNIVLQTVIKADNLDDVLDVVAWAEAHRIKISLSAYTSAKNGNTDHDVTENQMARLRALIDRLVELKATTGVIASSTYYLRCIPEYFQHKGLGACASGQKFLTVSPAGEIQRCSESPVACNYTDWVPGLFQPTDCRACWTSCRGECQAPITWERAKQAASLYRERRV